MNFNEYQEQAIKTAVFPEELGILYPTLGLMGESGEVAEKVKKLYRDSEGKLTAEFIKTMVGELGDVLWYLSALANNLGLDLNTVAEANLVKLKSRLERNQIHGDGDDR